MLKVCLTGDGYTEDHFKRLTDHGFEISHKTEHLSSNEIKKCLAEFDAYILGGDERLTEEELKEGTHLKVVSFVGTGYTSFIDESAANKYNISIKNTPAVMAPAVAEHTVGLVLGLQRKLFKQNTDIKNSKSIPCQTQEMSALCVGIVGLGEIGSRIARILKRAFGSDIIYASRTRKEALEAELGLQFVSTETLFGKADIIILALPTNTETKYFIAENLLEKTKPGVKIVNTAGAHLIEPQALKKFLDNQHIEAVAFDGYYIEPLPAVQDDPYRLLSLSDDRFVVTPHSAAKTKQSWYRMLDMAVDNVVQFFAK